MILNYIYFLVFSKFSFIFAKHLVVVTSNLSPPNKQVLGMLVRSSACDLKTCTFSSNEEPLGMSEKCGFVL